MKTETAVIYFIVVVELCTLSYCLMM